MRPLYGANIPINPHIASARCLYSGASILFRNLSAASHSLASKLKLAPLASDFFFALFFPKRPDL